MAPAATAVAPFGSDDDNSGDSGGGDAATAAGTDTDNNQLKAAVQGRWRQGWR